MLFNFIHFTYNNGKKVNDFHLIKHYAWGSGRDAAAFLTLAFSGVKRTASRCVRYIPLPGGQEFSENRERL